MPVIKFESSESKKVKKRPRKSAEDCREVWDRSQFCKSYLEEVEDSTALSIHHFFISSVCVPVQSINGLWKDYAVYCPKSSTVKLILLDPHTTQFSWKLFINRSFLRNSFLRALCFLLTSAEAISMYPNILPHMPTGRRQLIHMLLPSV